MRCNLNIECINVGGDRVRWKPRKARRERRVEAVVANLRQVIGHFGKWRRVPEISRL
jgi:hypothetical protein